MNDELVARNSSDLAGKKKEKLKITFAKIVMETTSIKENHNS